MGKSLGPLVGVRVQPLGDIVLREQNRGLAVVQPLKVLACRSGDDAERPQRPFGS